MKKAPLTPQRVFQAALEVIDAEGLDAVSMRRVGQALGVEAMSLYHHVKDKAALLDGVYELVLESMAPPPRNTSWALALKATALHFRAALQAHPNALSLFASRPAFTPNSLTHVEGVLAVLQRAGFPASDSLSVLGILVAYVVGHTITSAPPADDASFPDYESLSDAQYPYLKATAPHMPSHDLEGEFEMGLDLILSGLHDRIPKK